MGKAGVEMEVLEIKWDRGCMRVNLEEFLVNANQTKCKKLLKIIREKAPEQEDALKYQVQVYLQNRMKECAQYYKPDLKKFDKFKKLAPLFV